MPGERERERERGGGRETVPLYSSVQGISHPFESRNNENINKRQTNQNFGIPTHTFVEN